ncbi:hypothetical protein HYPSUDRAFT_739261 [Hypholoma sublateritium FD-334 SS-4]|uniref:Uncharacterized protein n=1 Tax=Hypholoma sublateritium (strain FD-334 SS-4) TaxID=945553 RepID=A0A0D2PN41_HYPSF|nr:hypothetical protein HYPSUDRAFT_739261 [Hypholoma sublateritium FD-334 SS-4]
MQVSVKCTDGTIPCGYGAVCCPPSDICNFNRGIPACENLAQPLISGFQGAPCADPYLNDFSFVGIAGFCCPIGTVCFNNGLNNVVSCINTYGTTASAFPSATQGFIPAATAVPNSNADIIFDPPEAWNSSAPSPSCSSSDGEEQLRVTSTLNATISFNYTGPSIMIHTVTSSQGGVFSLLVDDFNTTDIIDTFSG